MPAIIVLGIILGVAAFSVALLLTFVQVAILECPPAQADLSEEKARELFRQVSKQRVDPADSLSPTIEQLVRYGHLEKFLQATSGRSAG